MINYILNLFFFKSTFTFFYIQIKWFSLKINFIRQQYFVNFMFIYIYKYIFFKDLYL